MTNATTTAIAFRHAGTLDDLRACHPASAFPWI